MLLGIGGGGSAESRGVLSYGSKKSGVSEPVLRSFPLDPGKSVSLGKTSALFWRNQTVS